MRKTLLLLALMALTVLVSSGVALAINSIQCKTDTPRGINETCYGTAKRDLMKGTDGRNDMWGRGASDTLKGFRHTDYLFGQGGNDRLFGGPAPDAIYGDRGNDILDGGDGGDSYGFADGWGNDTIADTAFPPDKDTLYGNGLYLKAATYSGPINVDLNSDSGPMPEVTSGTNTIDWSGNVIDNVHTNSETNDRIVASDIANRLVSYNGFNASATLPDTDTVIARGGDDYVDVRDGFPGDIADCGEGNDTVRFDEGDELVVPDACESKNPPF